MRIVIVLCAILGVGLGLDVDTESLKPVYKYGIEEVPEELPQEELFPEANLRINNGQIAKPTDIPYAVGVLISMPEGPYFCGGVLISVNYVLTSADCVAMKNPVITILMGASDISKALDYIPVTKVKLHELYNKKSQINDIALLTLIRPAKLNDHVQLANLPRRAHIKNSFSNFLATMSGWGETRSTSSEPVPMLYLRYVRNNVITNFSCGTSFPFSIKYTHICTTSNRGATCGGDEGGPVTIEEQKVTYVIGIHSYSYSRGCERSKPSVHTRLAEYLDWIEFNTDVKILP